MSATRPWVDAFADEMERKLEMNRHKGDREGWMHEDPRWLLKRLREEVDELEALFPRLLTVRGADDPLYGPGGTPQQYRDECADIGCFSMMLADVVGRMRKKRAAPEETACE